MEAERELGRVAFPAPLGLWLCRTPSYTAPPVRVQEEQTVVWIRWAVQRRGWEVGGAGKGRCGPEGHK